MKKHIIIAIFAIFCGLTATVNAQILERNDIIYNSILLPQSNRLNPAFYPDTRNVYITLPDYSIGMGLPGGYDEMGLKYNNKTKKTTFDIGKIGSMLSENRNIHADIDVSVLGFGFHVKNMFFNFNMSVRSNTIMRFPSGLQTLLTDDLTTRTSKENALTISSKEFLSVQAYERFSLGMGYEINKNLTVGAHVNLLNGIGIATAGDLQANIYATDNAFSTLHADFNYRLMRAGQLQYDNVTYEVAYAHSFSNIGFSFDLGAEYKLNDFTFSASVIDLGPGIKWKENIRYTDPVNKSIEFRGLKLDSMIVGGNINLDYFDNFSDTIADLTKTYESDGEEQWHTIPTKIYVGAGYNINKFLRANLLFHGEIDKSGFRYSNALSIAFNIERGFELIASNAFAFDGESGSLFNPGIGVAIAPGNAVQLYFMADYISNFYLVETKAIQLQFGLNLCLGKKRNTYAHRVIETQVESIPEN